jgi:pSer/pThr/pTyr-binding forkhead associated (FHA) protein
VFGPHQASAAELQARIEAERAGAPFVFYYDAEGRQQLLSLGEGVTRLAIGRARDCAIRIENDGQVSRVHAELERVGEHWVIGDEGLSRNGTYLNEARISGRRRLADRDVVRVGLTAIAFREPAAASEPSTALGEGTELATAVTPSQRRVLVALCRPFAAGDAFASPATNPQIAAELFLTVAAVKTHLRGLFHAFDIEDLPQQEKRHRLVALAFGSGLVTERDLNPPET